MLINKKHTLYDAPPMQGGSREVNQVYASLAKLHKIVRVRPQMPFHSADFYTNFVLFRLCSFQTWPSFLAR